MGVPVGFQGALVVCLLHACSPTHNVPRSGDPRVYRAVVACMCPCFCSCVRLFAIFCNPQVEALLVGRLQTALRSWERLFDLSGGQGASGKGRGRKGSAHAITDATGGATSSGGAAGAPAGAGAGSSSDSAGATSKGGPTSAVPSLRVPSTVHAVVLKKSVMSLRPPLQQVLWAALLVCGLLSVWLPCFAASSPASRFMACLCSPCLLPSPVFVLPRSPALLDRPASTGFESFTA